MMPQNPSNNFGMAPAFSLKARLARENIVSQSVDGMPRGFSQPMLMGGGYQQNYPPQMMQQQQAYDPQMMMPSQYNNYPPQQDFNYPPPMMQQQPYQMPPSLAENPLAGYLASPNTNRKAPANPTSLPYPQPTQQAEDQEAKQKRMAAHIELQNDLLRQMEEKKMRKHAEETRKKMEEEVDELRVKRENEEMLSKDQVEVQKKKQMYQNFQQDNQKLISDKAGEIKNAGFVVLEAKKNERARTPIEQAGAHTKFAQIHQTIIQEKQQNQLNLENTPAENFPQQVGRHLQSSIEGQLEYLRRDWQGQQNQLHDQLLDLKHQLHVANQERSLTQDHIGELKSRIHDQQIGEEIRRTQLYNALLMGQNIMQQKPVYSNITRFPEENETDGYNFEFPKPKGRSMYPAEDEDTLDAMLAGQSKIISSPNVQFGNHGRFVERATSRPMTGHSALDGSSAGLNYLGYYGASDDNNGIKLDGKTGNFDIPDDWDKYGKGTFEFDESGGRGEFGDIYRKNKERLDRLEDLEHKELIGGYQDNYAKPRQLTGIDDEIYQMLKGDDI